MQKDSALVGCEEHTIVDFEVSELHIDCSDAEYVPIRQYSGKAVYELHYSGVRFSLWKDVMSGPIFDAMLNATRTVPNRGVWVGGKLRPWRECVEEADRAGRMLQGAGIGPGHIIATQLASGWDALVLFAAASRIGASVMPIHMSLGHHESAALLKHSMPQLFVTQRTHRGKDRTNVIGQTVAGAHDLQRIVLEEVDSVAVADSQIVRALTCLSNLQREVPASDLPVPGLLLVSSGTTSHQPKICIHSEELLLRNDRATAESSGYGADETFLAAGQLSHAFGLLAMHLALVTAGSLGLVPAWEPELFSESMFASKASVVLAAPAHLHDLLNNFNPEADGPLVPPGLKEIRTGGAPVSSDLSEAVTRATKTKVVVQWGMTEIGVGMFSGTTEASGHDIRDCGRPIPGCSARVVSDNGLPVTPGAVGLLQIQTPFVTRGYLGAAGATIRCDATSDGWLWTGDLAMESSGTFRIVGRADDRINRGGLKFMASELESHLDAMPELSYKAVLPVDDERLGQRAVLVATTTAEGVDVDLATVTTYLSQKGVARYKHPEELVLLESMPLTASGKVAKGQLALRLRNNLLLQGKGIS